MVLHNVISKAIVMKKELFSNGACRGGSDSWRTPKQLFNNLNREFNFTLDAAASLHNALCERYWIDAFKEDWSLEKSVWCNPPYSLCSDFLSFAHLPEQAVFLIPMRTQALWFLEKVWMNPYCYEVRYMLRGVRFESPADVVVARENNRSPMACVVLVYRNTPRKGEVRQTVICSDTGLLLHVIVKGSYNMGRPKVYDALTLDSIVTGHRRGLKAPAISVLADVPLRTVYRVLERL